MKKPELPPDPHSAVGHLLDVVAITVLVTIPVGITCIAVHYAKKVVGR